MNKVNFLGFFHSLGFFVILGEREKKLLGLKPKSEDKGRRRGNAHCNSGEKREKKTKKGRGRKGDGFEGQENQNNIVLLNKTVCFT